MYTQGSAVFMNHNLLGEESTKIKSDSLLVKLLIFSLLILGFGYAFDFGRGLEWLNYSESTDFLLLLLRLLFLSLLVERLVEFYILIFRSKGKKSIEYEIVEAISVSNQAEIKPLNRKLIEYKAQTRINSALIGFAIGIVMVLVGIRIFTGMFDFEDASILQIILFDIFEMILMGALMAGGSKGVNKVVSAIELLARPKPTHANKPN